MTHLFIPTHHFAVSLTNITKFKKSTPFQHNMLQLLEEFIINTTSAFNYVNIILLYYNDKIAIGLVL